MKKSERYPKEWESFQRCGAVGYISIAKKFDEQLAEQGWYSQHLTKSLPVIDPETSDFNSNRYNKPKTFDFYEEDMKIYAVMLACSIVAKKRNLTLKQQANIWYPESWLD